MSGGSGDTTHWTVPTEQHRIDDLAHFGGGPHDLRVEHGDWIFYAKVVPRGAHFMGGHGGSVPGTDRGLDLHGASDAAGLLLGILVMALAAAWDLARKGIRGDRTPEEQQRALEAAAEKSRRKLSRKATTVGVVRLPHPRTWHTDKPVVVITHDVPASTDFVPHLEALAGRAAAGEFTPSSTR